MQRGKPIQIQGKFLEDSAKIGQPIHYSLRVAHAKNQEVFYPSINQVFGKFESVKKDYFPTKTDGELSIDSAVYTFRLFDIQPYQTLQIPIYAVAGTDCTKILPKVDTIYLKRLLPNAAQIDLDSLYQQIQIKPLQPKPELKNVILSGLGILLFAGFVYWLFGRRIKQGFLLYKLWRKNREFTRVAQRNIRNIANTSKGLQTLEATISLWKKYVENLTGLPFSTFTTTEMGDHLPDDRLMDALIEVDSAIYGGNFSKNTIDAVQVLMEIAQTVYVSEQNKITRETT